jgi:hypothetical protein
MADKKFSAVISIGAELGASFRATFGGLDSRIKSVGASLRGLNDQQKGITGYAKALEAVNKARVAVVDAAKTGDRTQYDKARAALTKQTVALDKHREFMRAAGIDTSNLSGEMERLGREGAQATARLSALGKLKGATAELGASFRKLREDAAAAGIAVAAVGYSAWRVIAGFANMADEASETGSALGLTAQELLGLRYAGERVGIEAGKMDAALNKLNQQLADAQNGSKEASKSFDELGLDAEMLASIPASERMNLLADAFRNVRDPLDRTRLATDLFGAKAYKMANVLGLGAEGLRELRKEAKDTGYIPSEELIKRAEQFDSSFGAFKGTLIGIRNEIGGALLPIVNRFLTFATEHSLLLKAAVAGFALVMGGVAVVAVARLGLTAVTTVKQVGALITAMRTLGALEMVGSAGGLGSLVAMLKNAVPWITGLAGTWLPALATSIKAVGLAFAIAFGATPIGWIVAIGAAIVGLGILIYKSWQPIKTFLGGMWTGFTEGLREALGGIMTELRPIGEALAVVFSPLLWALGKLRDAFTWLISPFKQTNEQMQATAGIGRTLGRVLADTVLAPINLIAGALRMVRVGLAAVGIGSKPAASEGGGDYATSGAALPSPSTRLPSVPVAAASRNSSSATTNNSIVVNAAPGMDERALADEVMRRIRTQREQEQRGALYDNTMPAY